MFILEQYTRNDTTCIEMTGCIIECFESLQLYGKCVSECMAMEAHNHIFNEEAESTSANKREGLIQKAWHKIRSFFIGVSKAFKKVFYYLRGLVKKTSADAERKKEIMITVPCGSESIRAVSKFLSNMNENIERIGELEKLCCKNVTESEYKHWESEVDNLFEKFNKATSSGTSRFLCMARNK